ncbi:MAG: GxxExxY protein [Verrucomicrobiota bacterium]|jgi:GxxExxY protein|nr:GxxExxY protein [Verrucomicrobiota bacterium]
MLYEKESYAVRGALFEVYSVLGMGFSEEIYQEAVERELTLRGIPFEPQKELHLFYKGSLMNKTYRADVVCFGAIILELKAVKTLLPEHETQLLNYLKVTRLKLGLLVNFHHFPVLGIKRLIN